MIWLIYICNSICVRDCPSTPLRVNKSFFDSPSGEEKKITSPQFYFNRSSVNHVCSEKPDLPAGRQACQLAGNAKIEITVLLKLNQ